MMHKIFFAVAFLFPALNILASSTALGTAYISTYANTAVAEMHRTGIPASITLAQGMIESSYGRSELALRANNHFGIKCKTSWSGECYDMLDDDYDAEGNLTPSPFRVYASAEHSYEDHSDFLVYQARYQHLFSYGKDFRRWAKGLQLAGYATDTAYATKLIEVILKFGLHRYDHTTDEAAEFASLHSLYIDPEIPPAPVSLTERQPTLLIDEAATNSQASTNTTPPAPVRLPDDYRTQAMRQD